MKKKKSEIPTSEWRIFWAGVGSGMVILTCLYVVVSRLIEMLA